jgi:hypothetical protein
MSDKYMPQEKIYLVGDVRYTEDAKLIYEVESKQAPIDFLLSLQALMEEFGVIKLDISIDAFKYINCKNFSK